MSRKNSFAKWVGFMFLMLWIVIKLLLGAILLTSPFVALFACVTDVCQLVPVVQGKLWFIWLALSGAVWFIMIVYSAITSFKKK
jgi:hypothetical protein